MPTINKRKDHESDFFCPTCGQGYKIFFADYEKKSGEFKLPCQLCGCNMYVVHEVQISIYVSKVTTD